VGQAEWQRLPGLQLFQLVFDGQHTTLTALTDRGLLQADQLVALEELAEVPPDVLSIALKTSWRIALRGSRGRRCRPGFYSPLYPFEREKSGEEW